MIDVRELRIGNYVLNHKKEVKRVFSVQQQGFVSVETANGNPHDSSLLFPIPITEELLSKCGFKKHIWGSATFYYHSLIELDAHFCLKSVDYNIEIKSLHQLQNIYFSLIGKELDLRL